jgi:tetratricopeptide (TPR) repeat protein
VPELRIPDADMAAADTPPLVARDAELARLSELLGRALAGEFSVCFVAGEAGAGKSALLGEFARRAQERDPALVVAIGDCNAQTGVGDPYLPFREVLGLLTGDVDAKLAQGRITEENAGRLRDFLRISGESLLESGPDLVGIFVPGGSLLARLGGKLARRVPWMERMAELVERSEVRRHVGVGGIEQSHIFEQYTNVLRALSQHRPLVLILDDLQWADAASISLLFHLARRLGDARVLLVGAYRADDVALGRGEGRHPLESVLNELKRYYGDVWIDLHASQELAGRAFVDELLDARPNRYDEAFRASLYSHTHGHPLFTIELLRHLENCGDIVCDDAGRWCPARPLEWGALPPRVEGVIAERIARLDGEALDVLRVGSVEGETFTAEVVAAVRHTDGRRVVQRLSGELEKQHRLVAGQGLRRIGAQRLSLYGFRHNLFQRYLYGMLDASERSYLHEDVGRALEGLYGDCAPGIAVRLAHHFAEAGDVETAVGYLRQAGESAGRAFANAEAIEHYERALTLLAGFADAAARLAIEPALREARADVLELIGRRDEARDEYRRTLELVAADARVARARLHRKIGRTWQMQQHVEALAEFALAAGALGSEPVGDEAAWWYEWIQIHLARAWAVYFSGDTATLQQLNEQAAPVIERHGTPAQQSEFLGTRVMVRLRSERYRISAETVAIARRYREGAIADDDPYRAMSGRFEYGFCLLWAGESDAARSELEAVLELAERCGDLKHQTLATTYLAFAARFAGGVDETRQYATRALELADTGGFELYVAAAQANLAWAAFRAGDVSAAEQLANSAVETWQRLANRFPWPPYALLLLAGLHLDAGRLEAALDCGRQCLVDWLQRLPHALDEALRAALSAHERDDADAARAQLRLALEHGRAAGYL